jgi:spore coat protein H
MVNKTHGFLLMILLLVISLYGSLFLVNGKEAESNQTNETSNPSVCGEECSHLPILSIYTKGGVIQKDSKINVEIRVFDDVDGNSLDQKPQLDSAATINYRGNSSYYGFDKLQYRIEFYRNIERGRTRDVSLFGMYPDSEWILYGPFLDRSLFRNYLMYGLARELMPWAPDTRFFEMYLDDVYQGLYLAVEPVSRSEGRIPLNRFGLLSGATPYIVRRERVGTNHNVIRTYGDIMGYTSNELSILYPGRTSLTSKQHDWIERDVSFIETVIYSDFFDDPNRGYAAHINVESFVDYFILNEFAMITDAGRLSTYAYKDLNGKLTMTVWDFNNGFNNYQWFELDIEQLYSRDSSWYNRLLQDRTFVDLIMKRYAELRQAELSTQSIFDRLDGAIEYLGPAIDRNFDVWGYTFDQELLSKDAQRQVRDPRSYDEAVAMLKETIRLRLAYLDTHLDILYESVIN